MKRSASCAVCAATSVLLARCAADQRAEAPIARHRSFREARAREHHRHAAPPAFLEQIRPQLRLHDDCQARTYSRQESRRRSRRIVRHEANVDLARKQLLRSLPPGLRRGAQHQRNLRIAGPQRANQRRRGGYLAERYRVQPNARRPVRKGSPSEALAAGRSNGGDRASRGTAPPRKPTAPEPSSTRYRSGAPSSP